ncbi:MAG TPA: acetyltransferase [Cytophagales bacterium]|nr:acetyltransferase [Cytophagales bacterium]HAP64127.1 acetyltransferase [Cytophagales bacterium]
MDIARYLDRIGYTGDTSPSLTTLAALQKAHALAIPFESLDIHLGRKIRLDIPRIFEKVMEDRRGGFCYELNGLFHELLLTLGFDLVRISARVYNAEKDAYGPEFDHLTNLVTLEGQSYLTDVGFGDFAITPIPFQVNELYTDPWGTWRITEPEPDQFFLHKQIPEGWLPKYRFTRTHRAYLDFQTMCNYQQYDPNSHFRSKKVITLPTEQGRITLSSQTLKITEQGEATETPVENDDHFERLLLEYFGISLTFPRGKK